MTSDWQIISIVSSAIISSFSTFFAFMSALASLKNIKNQNIQNIVNEFNKDVMNCKNKTLDNISKISTHASEFSLYMISETPKKLQNLLIEETNTKSKIEHTWNNINSQIANFDLLNRFLLSHPKVKIKYRCSKCRRFFDRYDNELITKLIMNEREKIMSNHFFAQSTNFQLSLNEPVFDNIYLLELYTKIYGTSYVFYTFAKKRILVEVLNCKACLVYQRQWW